MAISPASNLVIDKTTGYINVEDINLSYRVIRVLLPECANPVGSGAGADVTVNFTGFTLPEVYAVMVTAGQKASPSVINKTSTGFDVVLSPVLATETIAVGTFDVEVVYQA